MPVPPWFWRLTTLLLRPSATELEESWWARVWPAAFGAALTIALQIPVFATPSVIAFLSGPMGYVTVIVLWLLVSFLFGCLFSKNRRLTRTGRFVAGAVLVVLTLVMGFGWRTWI